MSINRLRSLGPFLIMDKSSGEKNTTLMIPNNSEDRLIGIPLIATPLGLFFLRCMSSR